MDDFPTKNKKRADRRHQKMKMRNKAEKVARNRLISSYSQSYYDDEFIEDWSTKNAEHLKSCSCHLCGNKRKHFGKTLQEKKAEFAEMDYKYS
jgi:hypothetical protein